VTSIEPAGGMKKISIHIGGCHASNQPVVIETLLGSCVAVCLHDPIERVGGMNHILLPGRADFSKFDAVSRYGVNAIELLINKIMALGGRRQSLTAKVFGGAHVVPCISKVNGMGRRNAGFALEFLKFEGIPVLSKDLGGDQARRIYLHTDTGEVLLKRISFTSKPWLTVQERKLMEHARKEAEESKDITLFT
jgi:chemotaxis protein CheD